MNNYGRKINICVLSTTGNCISDPKEYRQKKKDMQGENSYAGRITFHSSAPEAPKEVGEEQLGRGRGKGKWADYENLPFSFLTEARWEGESRRIASGLWKWWLLVPFQPGACQLLLQGPRRVRLDLDHTLCHGKCRLKWGGSVFTLVSLPRNESASHFLCRLLIMIGFVKGETVPQHPTRFPSHYNTGVLPGNGTH